MVKSGYDDLVRPTIKSPSSQSFALTELRPCDRFKDAAIPIFFSEYGSQTIRPRLFQETEALYSPQMSQVFSGGCVYEFWHHANGYGLVEMHKQREIPKSSAYQLPLSRADDPSKVIEKRETEQGLLLIFHDFANYKAKLAATLDVESGWDRGLVELEVAHKRSVDTQMSWPWEPEFHEPESCVDWAKLGCS